LNVCATAKNEHMRCGDVSGQSTNVMSTPPGWRYARHELKCGIHTQLFASMRTVYDVTLMQHSIPPTWRR